MQKADFFNKAVPAALASGHIFPEYAVCESALESAWGGSELVTAANNLFGEKRGFATADCEVVEMNTREFLHGQWCEVTATWPKFADWTASFAARMDLLKRAPIYADALKAITGEQFVKLVSEHWSTDPDRASKVLATYRCNIGLIQNAKTLAAAKGA